MGALTNQLGFCLSVLKQQPFNVLIQVTNRCNFQCSFCDFWPNGVHPRQEVSVAEYGKLSRDLKRLGTFLVSIEGGEPFARKDLTEIVRAFSARHLTVLYTNGWYVTAENAKELFNAGLHQIGVSIDFPAAAAHDRKRGHAGAFERAVAAIQTLRAAAPGGEKQVHIMSVLMRENEQHVEDLLKLSQSLGVGHYFTLLSKKGFRRGKSEQDQLPSASLSAKMTQLYEAYPHFRAFRQYLEGIDSYLTEAPLPACRAGQQSFNIDHLGNVSACIEKIDRPQGNIRERNLAEILETLKTAQQSKGCQDCWTLCRSFGQSLGGGASLKSWADLVSRM